ncbi:MAG: histone H1 [Methylophilus sp.]|nr:histone H1 [Methylophilus sp.]
MTKRPKNLDLNQLAKRIVDEATGDEPVTSPPPEKNQAAVELGRLGGKKGGKARAEKLTDEQKSEIARNAANKRWKGTN